MRQLPIAPDGNGYDWPPYEDPGGDGIYPGPGRYRPYTDPAQEHGGEDIWPDLVNPGPGDYQPETTPVTENGERTKMKLWLWALIIAGVLYFMNQ